MNSKVFRSLKIFGLAPSIITAYLAHCKIEMDWVGNRLGVPISFLDILGIHFFIDGNGKPKIL